MRRDFGCGSGFLSAIVEERIPLPQFRLYLGIWDTPPSLTMRAAFLYSIRMKSAIRSVAVLAFGVTLFAVACRPAVKGPKIDLRGVSVRDADNISVKLQFHNPNSIAFNITHFEYRVAIESLFVGEGQRDAPLRLAPRDSVTAEFPLKLNYGNLARAIPSLLGDSVFFAVDGSYTVGTMFGSMRQKLHESTRMAFKAQLESVLRGFFK